MKNASIKGFLYRLMGSLTILLTIGSCKKDLPEGGITNLNCSSAVNSGILILDSLANNVSSSVPYTSVDGGKHDGQTVTSTGVTGLTATLAPGNFTSGTGSLTYTITGTPNSIGTASFALNIGGQSCTLTRTINLPAGSIEELNCSSATNNGTLISGVSADNVSSSVSYTSVNAGTHNGQTVTSTGVTGLTATLAPGTFASGTGSLTYTITGTPSTSGIASFDLNIGGQSCTLTRTISGQTGISAHTCGATNVHNPAKAYGSMTDQQGNVYKTIVIGTQEWMAENLKTSIYRNGNAIANVTDNNQWSGLTTGAFCYYNNDSQYDCPYGKLYNWYAVGDPRNVCPTGWHVPTDAEWSVLINYLDPNADGGNNSNVAGGKLRSPGLEYWLSTDLYATNESGFSGLPASIRTSDETFQGIGFLGDWWSSTEADAANAWDRYFQADNSNCFRSSYGKKNGLSVRCLRD
jgi:uncharacterized protein (TIGR02145 family)